jgi:hypothetical protein
MNNDKILIDIKDMLYFELKQIECFMIYDNIFNTRNVRNKYNGLSIQERIKTSCNNNAPIEINYVDARMLSKPAIYFIFNDKEVRYYLHSLRELNEIISMLITGYKTIEVFNNIETIYNKNMSLKTRFRKMLFGFFKEEILEATNREIIYSIKEIERNEVIYSKDSIDFDILRKEIVFTEDYYYSNASAELYEDSLQKAKNELYREFLKYVQIDTNELFADYKPNRRLVLSVLVGYPSKSL